MSGETIVVYGAVKPLASAGSAIANNSVAQASTASYDITVDGSSFPDAEFVLAATFSVAPTEGTVLALYARPLAIDSTNNAEAPETTRPTTFIGSFVVNDVTSTQYMLLVARDVPMKADYYIHNSGTGQSVSAGWTLKVKPRSYKAAA